MTFLSHVYSFNINQFQFYLPFRIDIFQSAKHTITYSLIFVTHYKLLSYSSHGKTSSKVFPNKNHKNDTRY